MHSKQNCQISDSIQLIGTFGCNYSLLIIKTSSRLTCCKSNFADGWLIFTHLGIKEKELIFKSHQTKQFSVNIRE